jgi:hypothetical protein
MIPHEVAMIRDILLKHPEIAYTEKDATRLAWSIREQLQKQGYDIRLAGECIDVE